MKTVALSFLGVLCGGLLAAPQQIPPKAPIYRAIERHEHRALLTSAPRAEIARRPDLTQVRGQAEKLSKLAESVTAGVAQAQKGIIPKDLGQNLKKIEKLSKRLRSELVL
jgi:hypothetical protein